MKEKSNYHKILRVSALVFALILVFESGLISATTVEISRNTHQYLANAIGMSASVPPTELNLYTAQLTQKERDLEAREAELQEREILMNLSADSGLGSKTTTYVLASILFILLVLILLNYVLDYLRIKERSLVKQTV